MAAYLTHLARNHAASPSVDDAVLREMTVTNLSEGLDSIGARRLVRMLPENWTERPVALDARMQPHEWIRTTTGFLKADAIDHHNDHFFPGCHDIAWDLAGAAIEFDLDRWSRKLLLERYRDLSRDRNIGMRLPHYATAYLAFRLGYATVAHEVLGETSDGFRFQALAGRYRTLLTTEDGPASVEFWNV
jgi:hypothetical protein